MFGVAANSESNIAISTVGNPDGIAKIGEFVRENGFHRLNLALSLNAPNDEIRSQIMPVNKAWPMARLKEALLAFPRFSKAAFCVEYVLIPGVNDADAHCDEVCALLKPLRCSLNVIPYNPRRASPWPAPTEESVQSFVQRAKAGELGGARVDPTLVQRVQPTHLAPLAPIDDVRGSAAYRQDAVLTLLRRLLGEFVP